MSAPHWSFRPPDEIEIAAFVATVGTAEVSYPEKGASRRGIAVPGYEFDHNRVQLGVGADDFAAGVAALRGWTMFPQPWTKISPANAPIQEGQVVGMIANALGLWWLNACRVVYVFDDVTPVRRFGFAYGTLPAHVERGEERFCVEMLDDGSVWYDLCAFSRPRFWPVRLAKPLARRLQFRFARESKAAMLRAVVAARTARRK